MGVSYERGTPVLPRFADTSENALLFRGLTLALV